MTIVSSLASVLARIRIPGAASRHLVRLSLIGGLSLLGACSALQQRPEVEVLSSPPTRVETAEMQAARLAAANAPQTVAANGSIFQTTPYRGLFEDRRARRVGDILTIQIQERTSARQKADTSLGRDGKLDASIGALPLFSANSFGKAAAKGSSSTSLDSKGETGTDNTFTGTITVTVIKTLPNGNLLVAGDKQVGINHNVDVMRFSGVVNPSSIQPGNQVPSTEVAEARLDYRGRGDMDKAQTTGFLSRFFMSWAPI